MFMMAVITVLGILHFVGSYLIQRLILHCVFEDGLPVCMINCLLANQAELMLFSVFVVRAVTTASLICKTSYTRTCAGSFLCISGRIRQLNLYLK